MGKVKREQKEAIKIYRKLKIQEREYAKADVLERVKIMKKVLRLKKLFDAIVEGKSNG